jgi:hypothetical protein
MSPFRARSSLDDALVAGALPRRIAAWAVDLCLIVILVMVMWVALTVFGVLTLGFGFAAMAILPFVPFLYYFLSLASEASSTPGQQLFGLVVRRNDDLGQPEPTQALISTLGLYMTVATSGALLVVAVFTRRNRTLHDIMSGLVVVRASALEALTTPPPRWKLRRVP